MAMRRSGYQDKNVSEHDRMSAPGQRENCRQLRSNAFELDRQKRGSSLNIGNSALINPIALSINRHVQTDAHSRAGRAMMNG